MDEIESATTEELFDEIAKRHSAAILLGLKKVGDGQEVDVAWYEGGRIACIGLLENAKHKLLEVPGEEMEGDDV